MFIPYAINTEIPDFIIYITFFYRGKKYVAFKMVEERVMFFSWHSLHRYSERFLEVQDPIIDNEFIGDMLIYNRGFCRTTYTYKGILSKMYITTDGGFLCEEYDKCIVANTFIPSKEYFSNQEELDSSAFEELKRTKKETYGYWINRA